MLNTYVRPSRDLRNNYSEIVKIVKDHNHVIITNNGRGEAVLIGIEEFADYEEYVHKKYVLSELKKAKEQANAPETKWLSENEFWKNVSKDL